MPQGRKVDEAIRAKAVDLYVTHGMSTAAIGQRFCVSGYTVGDWLRAADVKVNRGRKFDAMVGNSGSVAGLTGRSVR